MKQKLSEKQKYKKVLRYLANKHSNLNKKYKVKESVCLDKLRTKDVEVKQLERNIQQIQIDLDNYKKNLQKQFDYELKMVKLEYSHKYNLNKIKLNHKLSKSSSKSRTFKHSIIKSPELTKNSLCKPFFKQTVGSNDCGICVINNLIGFEILNRRMISDLKNSYSIFERSSMLTIGTIELLLRFFGFLILDGITTNKEFTIVNEDKQFVGYIIGNGTHYIFVKKNVSNNSYCWMDSLKQKPLILKKDEVEKYIQRFTRGSKGHIREIYKNKQIRKIYTQNSFIKFIKQEHPGLI